MAGFSSLNDRLFKTIRLFGSPFAYRCTGLEHIPRKGPAIYVANHLESVGPIQMILSVPVRVRPWVIAEMVDFERAPQYLFDDFVHPAWHLKGRFGMMISTLVSRLAVRLLRGLGSVSVDRNRGTSLSHFRKSLSLLKDGKNLLVFPEDPYLPLNPETNMRPFMCGFILLAPLYQSETGDQLPLIPVAVSQESRTVALGAPLYYECGSVRNRVEVLRICKRLEVDIHRMYRSLTNTVLMICAMNFIERVVVRFW